jgi:hypothetical protein
MAWSSSIARNVVRQEHVPEVPLEPRAFQEAPPEVAGVVSLTRHAGLDPGPIVLNVGKGLVQRVKPRRDTAMAIAPLDIVGARRIAELGLRDFPGDALGFGVGRDGVGG